MNKKINKIINLNKELANKTQASISVVSRSLAKTKFRYTSKALLSFIPKSGYLNSSILDSYINKNIYSAGILFRSMIEHSFRHLYIFTRALNENSDSIGNKYYNSLKANEDLESFREINNYNKVVYPEKTKWSTKGNHNNLIRKAAKEFRIEQIFYYLIGNNNGNNIEIVDRFKKEYLLERLIQYTELSSGVHGGPFGELMLEKLHKSKVSLEKKLYKFAMDSFILHKSTIESTYLFAYLMDSNIQKHYEEIKNLNK
ncbi:MAG: hypothetical protein NT012_01170 [Candidatus Nealsonbacteria bacterium]|nr:hypothetical protein [Candidatus Nealsonbacteria bacterium]